MPQEVVDVDVLIVGAGPVGLFLANECARRGLRWRLVEARAAQSEHSKALAIFPRTLEIFDMAGVAAPFLDRANRVTSVSVVSHGRRLAHLRFAPEESIYPFIAMVPQDVTEALLVDALGQKRGRVEYETSLVSAEQQSDHVVATIEQGGRRQDTTAAFVVGCDGAHSTVRHLLSLPFAGGEYTDSFMLADVESNDVLPASELQLCPGESGPLAIFPMSATRRRIVATVEHGEGDAPPLALVRRILAERAPAAFEARSLHWSAYFRIHHRHVARLRVGRMFIAGDAAHIHSPFGGQGMNTGLHDVWNLAWKLDLVLHGRGGDDLLESYTTERIPVITHVIETTDLLTRVMGTPSRWAQLLRDAAIPMVSRLAPFQHAFVRRLSELGVAYPHSPIVEGAGERYFDESFRGGGIGNRFVLMVGAEADGAARASAARFAEEHREVVEMRAAAGRGISLVRPDGYAAYTAREASPSALGAIETLLGRQMTARPGSAQAVP